MAMPKLDIPKPQPWDLVAVVVMGLGAIVAGWNLTSAMNAPTGEGISTALTSIAVVIQLALCVGGLLVLGKTAKEGTIWGNLAAVGAMLLGMTGVLLATSLWAIA